MTDMVPLGELLEAARTPVAIDPTQAYRPVGLRSFGNGIIRYPQAPAHELSKLRYFRLAPSRIVISNIKGWEGAVTTTTEDEHGYIASNRFLQYTSRGNADLNYVKRYLLSETGIGSLGQASPGSADRNRTLSITNFERIEIPLPDLAEQKRIADYLDTTASTVSQIIRQGANRASLLRSVTHNEQPGVSVPLGELVSRVRRPVPVRTDDSYGLAGVRWYGDGVFHRETRYGRDLSAKTLYEVAPGDLVYNRLFAWKQSFAIAESHLFASNEFPTYEIDRTRILPEVLLAQLLSPQFTALVNQASTGSTPTSRNRLKEENFESLPVTVPEPHTQRSLAMALRLARDAQLLNLRSQTFAEALLPAARNEVFSALM